MINVYSAFTSNCLIFTKLLYRKLKYRDAIFVIPILFLSLSCATIINTTKQEINISSSPIEAKVFINGQDVGITPVIQELKRKTDVTIRIELDGYNPYEIILTRKISGWFWVNLFTTGFLGAVVDASTGALYRFEPAIVNANLIRDSETLYIFTNLEIDYQTLTKIGQLTKKK